MVRKSFQIDNKFDICKLLGQIAEYVWTLARQNKNHVFTQIKNSSTPFLQEDILISFFS